MAHPLLWPFKTFFYPIGNTPAVCLTQDLRPEQAADVLLLGCGDPRNVLYTAYADLRVPSNVSRKLDVTCCDIEPAILARNAVLYVAIISGASSKTLWNIFYHMLIDEEDQKLLSESCQLLLASSSSMDAWHASELGSWLVMCSSWTLIEMRRHWQLYVDFPSVTSARHHAVRSKRDALMRKVTAKGDMVSICRSAAMFWPEAMSPVNELFKTYWTTGALLSSPSDTIAATLINPMFVYSLAGEEFDVHYGTFPLQAFHLSAAFADSSRRTAPFCLSVIQKQFASWCKAFRNIIWGPKKTSLTIRFCIGDALAFCQAWQQRIEGGASEPPLFVSPFTTQLLHLDGPSAPAAFDVIDTSNLMDHLGLLNILIACTPLLKPSTVSVMYTEAMIAHGKDKTTSFLSRLCGDPATVSVLFGLAPRDAISGFATQCNSHELLMDQGTSSPGVTQFHQRVTWCAPSAPEPPTLGTLTFEPMELGQLLFQQYEEMFAHERLEAMRDVGLSAAYPDYSRSSFARFVRLVKSRMRIRGTWEAVMAAFMNLVQTNMRFGALLYYQDLCMQLHRFGLFSTSVLESDWKSAIAAPNPSFEVFKGWKEPVPPIVWVMISVSREQLALLSQDKDFGSCQIYCRLTTGKGDENLFCSDIQALPGCWDAHSSTGAIRIAEDPQGPRSARSFIVAFAVPSWILTFGGCRVTIGIPVTARNMIFFSRQLGPQLSLASALLTDRQRVRIVPQFPSVPSSFGGTARSDATPGFQSSSEHQFLQAHVNVCGTMTSISTFTARMDISENQQRSSISPSVSITTEHVSPCAMEIRIGGRRQIVGFPYPIVGLSAKVRIARKSLYVEITVPLARPPQGGCYQMRPFPVVQSSSPLSWNIHHINLNAALRLDLSQSKDLGWLDLHIGTQFSIRERAIRDRHQTQSSEVPSSEMLLSVKDSLHLFFGRLAGLRGRKPSRIFGLVSPESSSVGVFALLFVQHLYIDLAAFTVVADVVTLPLDLDLMPTLISALSKLPRQDTINIGTTAAEAVAWKHLLCAATERCRTWTHGANCQYAVQGRIPLSTELNRSPLCACGRGIGLPETMAGVPPSAWKIIRAHATRAAISPLFAVSYIEPILGEAKTKAKAKADADVLKGGKKPAGSSGDRCLACASPGKPKLSTCGRCKKAQYCSVACSRANWKTHKPDCKPA